MRPCKMTAFALLAALATAGAASGRDDPPEVSEKEARKAIATFLEAPLAPGAKEAAKKIAVFVISSKDVVVVVGKQETAWLGKEVKHGSLLAIAYLAGSARAQLDTGVARHDPYSGLLQVFRVYRAVQKKDRAFRVAELDRLLALHREGKLLKHLAELQEKPAGKKKE